MLLFAVMLGWEKEWFVAIALLFTILLLSGCLGVVPCLSDAEVRKRRWFVAIALLFTILLMSGCLGVVPCCSDAAVKKEGDSWRLCCYLQHFCSPAALVSVLIAVLMMYGKGCGA